MARRSLPWRRAGIPADLRDRVGRSTRERVIGWSRVAADGWAVATDSGLRISAGEWGSDDEPLVLTWSRIVRARWADGSLEVLAARGEGVAAERFVLAIQEDGLLAEAVQAKVTESLLWEQRIDLDGAGALFVGRRSADGGVDWTVAFDRGVDPADEASRRWADEQLAQIKAQTGL